MKSGLEPGSEPRPRPGMVARCWRAIGWAWAGLTRVRQAVANLLFIALLIALALLLIDRTPASTPGPAALLLNPTGRIVDQRSPVDPLQLLSGAAAPLEREILLQDVLDAIDLAAEDPAITALVMQLDSLLSVGLSKTQEIQPVLNRFRDSGKPIVALGDFFSQDQYLLASQADEVIMHPMGALLLVGFGSYRNYYHDALEKLSVNVHVFKAGEHKSMAEPYLRNDMSPAERKITLRWLQDLWGQYTGMVETHRRLAPGMLHAYVNDYPERLAQRGGDAAATALSWNLVDQLLTRDESNRYLVAKVGAADKTGHYRSIGFEQYLAENAPVAMGHRDESRVAVITAQGDILPGEHAPGSIGGDSLASLIRATAEQDGVEALVLRINSGGGSVFASDIIRSELDRVQADGMPLVVSMGAVAASGGYYIAAGADQIWATPATLTGSIGVFAAFPTVERLLARGGIYTDGVGTTASAGSLRLDRPLDPGLAAALTSTVNFTYRGFLERVAAGRRMTTEAVDAVAQGRVWSAGDALERGLVDRLGDLNDAIEAAAGLAHLTDYAVDHVGYSASAGSLLLERLLERIQWLPHMQRRSAVPAALWTGMYQSALHVADEVSGFADPGHLYMRCLSCMPLTR